MTLPTNREDEALIDALVRRRLATKKTRPLHQTLLAASTNAEIDDAFNLIFDLVSGHVLGYIFGQPDARAADDVQRCDALLEWLTTEVDQLHPEILVTCLRLTFTMRESLPSWKPAVAATEESLTRRGEGDVGKLLCGLTGPFDGGASPRVR